jgi:hypothetical protein
MSYARCTNLGLVLGSLAVCFGLAGCSDYYYERRDTLSLSTGEAQASNRVTQMVDPWPGPSSNRNLAFSGERMQAAVERYRKGTVTPPANAMTSSTAYQAPQINLVAPGGKP